jgi:hypothetical protein
MTVAVQSTNRAPRPSGLADVLELVLDRGVVIDAYVRVAVIGIEVLTLDARVVIASVDTYLRFAEAVNRLDLQPHEQAAGLPGLVDELREGGARQKTKGALSGVKETAKDTARELGSSARERVGSGSSQRRAPAGRSAPRGRRPSRRSEQDDEG